MAGLLVVTYNLEHFHHQRWVSDDSANMFLTSKFYLLNLFSNLTHKTETKIENKYSRWDTSNIATTPLGPIKLSTQFRNREQSNPIWLVLLRLVPELLWGARKAVHFSRVGRLPVNSPDWDWWTWVILSIGGDALSYMGPKFQSSHIYRCLLANSLL
jgi:hypothetical protein